MEEEKQYRSIPCQCRSCNQVFDYSEATKEQDVIHPSIWHKKCPCCRGNFSVIESDTVRSFDKHLNVNKDVLYYAYSKSN